MWSGNGEIRFEIRATQERCGEGHYRNESSYQRNLGGLLSQELESTGEKLAQR